MAAWLRRRRIATEDDVAVFFEELHSGLDLARRHFHANQDTLCLRPRLAEDGGFFMQTGKFISLIPAPQNYGTLIIRDDPRGDASDSRFTSAHISRLSL